MTGTRVVALLRGINVAGKNLISMPDLVRALEKAGHHAVETYIQSGNVFFDSEGPRVDVERAVQDVIKDRFKLTIPTIARTAVDWKKLCTAAQFEDAQRERPKFLHVGLAKQKLNPSVVEALMAKATTERVEIHGETIFIDFFEGAGRSKLTPSVIDKAAGSAVTLRNWNTTLEIARRLGVVP